MLMDLNADLGELQPDEASIMPFVTSANIACGGHVGDAASMAASLSLAAQFGVAAGAHPGYPDREGFGRRELALSTDAAARSVREQLAALQAVARQEGVELHHVKPHGALYNRGAREPQLALAVAQAVRESGISRLYGLAGSAWQGAAQQAGLDWVPEAFADRGYRPDGSLVPRGEPGALLSAEAALKQAVSLALGEPVMLASGEPLVLRARTLCLHGDGPEAASLAAHLHTALAQAGVQLAAP